MKIVVRSLLATAALLGSMSVLAQSVQQGEKQVNRAKVESVSARLRLPDGKMLHMGMEPCVEGSRFKGLSIIGTSDFGIKIISAGLSALYGYEWGEKATKAWLTKAHEDDPRLPTMLVIMEPQHRTSDKSAKRTNTSEADSSVAPFTMAAECGVSGEEHVSQ